jgi:hypothetical protein
MSCSIVLNTMPASALTPRPLCAPAPPTGADRSPCARITRPRPAPRAVRSAISPCLDAVRVSIRFAMIGAADQEDESDNAEHEHQVGPDVSDLGVAKGESRVRTPRFSAGRSLSRSEATRSSPRGPARVSLRVRAVPQPRRTRWCAA